MIYNGKRLEEVRPKSALPFSVLVPIIYKLQFHNAYQCVKQTAGWPTGHALQIPGVLCEKEEK